VRVEDGSACSLSGCQCQGPRVSPSKLYSATLSVSKPNAKEDFIFASKRAVGGTQIKSFGPGLDRADGGVADALPELEVLVTDVAVQLGGKARGETKSLDQGDHIG